MSPESTFSVHSFHLNQRAINSQKFHCYKKFIVIQGLSFSVKFYQVVYIVAVAETFFNKIGVFILQSLFYSEVALYLYKFTIQPVMKCCCHVCAGALSCSLYVIDKLQKQVCRAVGTIFATLLETLAYRQFVASLSLFCRYYFRRCLFKTQELTPLLYS